VWKSIWPLPPKHLRKRLVDCGLMRRRRQTRQERQMGQGTWGTAIMTGQSYSIDEAALWHVASARDDMDWDAFTLWLEADPDHRARFEEIAQADAVMCANRPALDRSGVNRRFRNPSAPGTIGCFGLSDSSLQRRLEWL
jgi:hypothetical protein